MEQGMDLTDAIRWAGQAAIHGTDANNVLHEGLRSILHATGEIRITNPVSSARDGVTPDLTRVLLCEVQIKNQTQRLCIKLYPFSASGQAALNMHAHLLSRLKNTVPVPDLVEVLPEPGLFRFPALVTTAPGQPLDLEFQEIPMDLQEGIIIQTAEAVAALHSCDPDVLSIDSTYDPKSIYSLWQEDAVWYEKHAQEAGRDADLVRTGAAVLAECCDVPSCGSVLHRDLTPYNILAENGAFTALIDWDHAGFSAPEEDIGKTLIGLLSMLSIPRNHRLSLACTFLEAYSRLRSLSREDLFLQSLPFALDTLLDWVIGGKNAPQEELSWATEQILLF